MQQLARFWWRRATAPPSRSAVARLVGVAVPALAAATALVWLLEEQFGLRSAAPVYLLAVVAVALVSGTGGALAAAVIGMLLYDYLFTEPLHTFFISDPGEWLDLVLLLFVGLVVGQLTALERARALTAESREREARELFLISRALATRSSTAAVLPEITEPLARAADMAATWITLGADDAAERVAAEWGSRPPVGGLFWQLRRFPGDRPAQWIRIHPPTAGRTRLVLDQAIDVYRVRIEAGGRPLGSVWAARERRNQLPDRTATRLLSAAADQIGQALALDRLAAEASAADVARQSDALKTALLQSVSHDLRTPLATIRAAAGTLQPDSDLDADGRRASASAIEREVERLDRLVANLLDLGRIEAGELRADLDVFELDDLVGRTVDRFAARLAGHDLRLEVPPIPVLVDPVFLDEALTNLLDNALKFTGPDSMVRIHATRPDSGPIRLVVEDDGAGVPTDLLPRLFEKFFRAPPSGPRTRPSRPGTGIGLAVVRGLMQAMGGSATARASELGGLAVELELPLAALPAELLETAAP
ncbi:MAG: two-component system, OmpR family, sensor histidine kinase KdpD [Chloroflexota bacterium]|nr:two-component system, OmpR family, sensor histidine kinase KdpD [Chloroflexota bacterium]